MLDLAGYAAFDVYRAIRLGMEAEADERSRASRSADRRSVRKDSHKGPPTRPSGPLTLTGAHTPWI